MKAYVVEQYGSIGLHDVPDPATPEDGVVLKIHRCGACSSDVSAFRGTKKRQVLPFIPGHEYVGTVVDRGARSLDLPLGTRIAIWGNTTFGGLAEYRAVRPQFSRSVGGDPSLSLSGHQEDDCGSAVIIPDHLSDTIAVLIEPMTCVHRALLSAPPVPGSNCVIMGAGPFGVMAALLLRAIFAPRRITLLEQNTQKISTLKQMGIIDFGFDDADAQSEEHDYVFDALGDVRFAQDEDNPRTRVMSALSPHARYVPFGTPGQEQQVNLTLMIAKGIRLQSAPWDIRVFPKGKTAAIMESVTKLLESDLLPAHALVGDEISFYDEAHVDRLFRTYGSGDAFSKDQIVVQAQT
ncbi:MAG: alcohol dehydrogenase catalytic domain-containing protein [Pseudomonadota bacterium]